MIQTKVFENTYTDKKIFKLEWKTNGLRQNWWEKSFYSRPCNTLPESKTTENTSGYKNSKNVVYIRPPSLKKTIKQFCRKLQSLIERNLEEILLYFTKRKKEFYFNQQVENQYYYHIKLVTFRGRKK